MLYHLGRKLIIYEALTKYILGSQGKCHGVHNDVRIPTAVDEIER